MKDFGGMLKGEGIGTGNPSVGWGLSLQSTSPLLSESGSGFDSCYWGQNLYFIFRQTHYCSVRQFTRVQKSSGGMGISLKNVKGYVERNVSLMIRNGLQREGKVTVFFCSAPIYGWKRKRKWNSITLCPAAGLTRTHYCPFILSIVKGHSMKHLLWTSTTLMTRHPNMWGAISI